VRHDAVVVGLGAVGAAALYQLARRGIRVLGVDRFAPPHAMGSSHGETRITRLAIGEGDEYVALARRSHEIWREIGQDLLVATGGLWISSPARQAESHVADFFANTLRAARRFGIAHETLDAAQIRARFPQFNVSANEVGYFEPEAGYVRPEACVAAQLELARHHGAEIRFGETVSEPHALGDQVIVAAGARVPRLLPHLAGHFAVTRQVQFWFAPQTPAAFAPARFPVFIWELQTRRNVIYGFPEIAPASGVKVATEQYTRTVDPDDAAWRSVDAGEGEAMHRDLVAPHLAGLTARVTKAVPCLYTATSSFRFVVDRDPAHANVIVASACSGHGFKHSAAVGEAIAEWIVAGRKPDTLMPFTWR
jgi:sarcosine oxidase